jgi:uncharacterized membrane protein
MKSKLWLVYAIITTLFWGVWGAFTGLPTSYGFPETLIYCVWAVTMIPPAFIALKYAGWQLNKSKKAVFYGLLIGLLGAGGQMILFRAVTLGPSYLIFPIISLSPMVTIVLSYLILKERTGILGTIGIILALVALPLFDYSGQASEANYGLSWFPLAILVLLAWGVQAYFMKLANDSMNAESIFFYMMVSGLLLIPVAWWMTDFSAEINYGPRGPWLAAGPERHRRTLPCLRLQIWQSHGSLAYDKCRCAFDNRHHFDAAVGIPTECLQDSRYCAGYCRGRVAGV